jgi:hypothetical protein
LLERLGLLVNIIVGTLLVSWDGLIDGLFLVLGTREGILEFVLGTREGILELGTREGILELGTREGILELGTREGILELGTREGILELGTREGILEFVGFREIGDRLGVRELGDDVGLREIGTRLGAGESGDEVGLRETGPRLGTGDFDGALDVDFKVAGVGRREGAIKLAKLPGNLEGSAVGLRDGGLLFEGNADFFELLAAISFVGTALREKTPIPST